LEAEIRRIEVQDHHGQIVHETLCPKMTRASSRVQSPEFKSQSYPLSPKKRKKGRKNINPLRL
jgi:hypothetical protein